jgi:hypothetical protein
MTGEIVEKVEAVVVTPELLAELKERGQRLMLFIRTKPLDVTARGGYPSFIPGPPEIERATITR